MTTQPDFEELLRLLEKHKVDYMIVGGYAVAFHGYPRFTKDIDVFYDVSTDNLERLRNALMEFGFQPKQLATETFTDPGAVVTFGIAPVRVDLLNSIDGVKYPDARAGRVRGRYGRIEVSFIGRAELLRNKRATGRLRDAADAEELEPDRQD